MIAYRLSGMISSPSSIAYLLMTLRYIPVSSISRQTTSLYLHTIFVPRLVCGARASDAADSSWLVVLGGVMDDARANLPETCFVRVKIINQKGMRET
jgi:hypothetical protein